MILVTGAAGNVGSEVVRALLARGARVRAADRSPERLRALFGDRVERVLFDYDHESTFGPAVAGCDALFLLRPPPISDVKKTLNVLIDRARAAGVAATVFLSVAGAEKNPLVPHHAVEQKLIAGPADWTILRPGFFAQNFEGAYRRDIIEDGRIFVPAGKGLVAFVDVRDLAVVAAHALLDPRTHRGKAYTLTGPDAVSFEEAAEFLSITIGRPIRYEEASLVGYARHLLSRDIPRGQIVVQTILHAGLRLGQAAKVDPTLAALIGTPRTLAQYFSDRAALLQTPDRRPTMPHRTNAAAEIVESHEGFQGVLADATCAAHHLVLDPSSDDAPAQAKEVAGFIRNEALPHMEYEEAILFPRAEANGVPKVCLDALKDEHEILRRLAEHIDNEQVGDSPINDEQVLLLLEFVRQFDEHATREEAVLSLFSGDAAAE